MLPEGVVRPNSLEPQEVPSRAGYRVLLAVGAVVWVAGLFAILFWRRRDAEEEQHEDGRPRTLAERLRPMVELGLAGELPEHERAELERTLIAYWRRRLDLVHMDPGKAMAALREHDEAGRLLVQLEHWLHRPGPADDVDVGELLAPYRDLPEDALTAEPARVP